ncbi:hypothetical protein [Chitinophaga filiformis]|uniref:Uncharacterized protein n=1 Tax=Chitinophaga filiformis TaxID=104663 RepID=A0ABY4I9R7_CHIFI|nr:hypothetical protein [Chitinophaga filiformis]UPK72862.1 hypothetical protein MYF79_16345 [Chitinophaga filiformis]
MFFNSPRPWDNLPLRLSVEEIRDPHEAIHEYFSSYDMPGARQIINQWFGSTSKKRPSKISPSGLQFFYDRTESFIEAAFLVAQLDNRERKGIIVPCNDEEIDVMNPILFCAWIKGIEGKTISAREAWDTFPRNLSYKEFLNPYLAFEKFFSFLTLGEWREALRELLGMGMSRRTFLDETIDFDLLGIKKRLEKLLEAGHLIDVREYRQVFYDSITGKDRE